MLTLEFVFEKMYEIFRYFFNRLKNIVNMHREHYVWVFSNIVKNIDVNVFF